MMALMKEPMPIITSPTWMPTSEKSALKNRPMAGLMMSFTSELTMAVKAPPITTPTAISSTLPRMAKALNSSKNIFDAFHFFFCHKKIHSFTPFMPQGNVFASMIADFWRDCKGK